VVVVCDEIYEFLLAPGHSHHSLAAVAPDLASRIFIVSGCAKGWAMTGWRIGWLAGAREVIAAASALQSQTTSNVCTFAQYGGLAAITGSRNCVHTMAQEFNRRRTLLGDGLQSIPGLELLPPEGAFYAFPDMTACLGRTTAGGTLIGSDLGFVFALLSEAGVATVHGSAFMFPGHFRISFAAADGLLDDACQRIRRFCEGLS
jgi:aspartate aminotransferase